MQRNQIQPAIGSMGALVNQVKAFVQTGKLTPAQGAGPIYLAELLVTGLRGNAP